MRAELDLTTEYSMLGCLRVRSEVQVAARTSPRSRGSSSSMASDSEMWCPRHAYNLETVSTYAGAESKHLSSTRTWHSRSTTTSKRCRGKTPLNKPKKAPAAGLTPFSTQTSFAHLRRLNQFGITSTSDDLVAAARLHRPHVSAHLYGLCSSF